MEGHELRHKAVDVRKFDSFAESVRFAVFIRI